LTLAQNLVKLKACFRGNYIGLCNGGFEVEVVDLAAINLPLFDEPNRPRFCQYVLHQHTKECSPIVDASDAFLFVMPEYNYGFNAAIKNAIDYLHHE
jgi:NAD(P)H-dependent FMN reductase